VCRHGGCQTATAGSKEDPTPAGEQLNAHEGMIDPGAEVHMKVQEEYQGIRTVVVVVGQARKAAGSSLRRR
jgi:hypothetical protein